MACNTGILDRLPCSGRVKRCICPSPVRVKLRTLGNDPVGDAVNWRDLDAYYRNAANLTGTLPLARIPTALIGKKADSANAADVALNSNPRTIGGFRRSANATAAGSDSEPKPEHMPGTQATADTVLLIAGRSATSAMAATQYIN